MPRLTHEISTGGLSPEADITQVAPSKAALVVEGMLDSEHFLPRLLAVTGVVVYAQWQGIKEKVNPFSRGDDTHESI